MPMSYVDAVARTAASDVNLGTRPSAGPYKLALFGDSRVGASIATSGQSLPASRMGAPLLALLGDTAMHFSGGISGEGIAAAWSGFYARGSASTNPMWGTGQATRDQSIAALIASQPDIVVMQEGINDIIGGATAATTGLLLCRAIQTFTSANIPVVFNSIEPANDVAATYVTGAASGGGFGTGPAAKAQAVADTNRIVRNFIATLPSKLAVYVNTHDALLDPARILGTNASGDQYGYCNAAYYADGTHMRSAGAYAIVPMVAAAVRALLPKRSWFVSTPPAGGPNLVNQFMLNPASGLAENFSTAAQIGSTTSAVASIVTVEGLPAQQWVITPGALSGATHMQQVFIAPPIFGATPTYPVAIGDKLTPYLRFIIDDGAGGTPSGIAETVVRHRYFNDDATSVYQDVLVSTYVGDTTPLTTLRPGPIDLSVCGLPLALTKGSLNILSGAPNYTGIGLRITTTSLTPYRIRIVAPCIRKVN